jgi:hypothetical protein
MALGMNRNKNELIFGVGARRDLFYVETKFEKYRFASYFKVLKYFRD